MGSDVAEPKWALVVTWSVHSSADRPMHYSLRQNTWHRISGPMALCGANLLEATAETDFLPDDGQPCSQCIQEILAAPADPMFTSTRSVYG